MIKNAEVITGIFLISILLNSCFLIKPKTEVAENENSENKNDSTEIIKMPFKHKRDLIEYEVSVLKGTETRHGVQKRFYEHGSVYSKTPYVNGKKHGTAYTYYQEYKGEELKVWKEQPYSHGLLSGKCCRYHRNGKLQSEYEYKNGLPGVGIKIWKESGDEVKLPRLIVSKEESNGLIRIKARISNNTKKAKYFTTKLIENKYIPRDMKPVDTESGVGEIVLTKETNKKYVTIVAALKTPYRNTYYLAKTIAL